MTAIFGPIGQGWRFAEACRWIQGGADGEVMCFVKVFLVYRLPNGDWSEAIEGIGGSTLVEMERNGLHNSDEGWKMATTDALGNACKYLGLAADVYLGTYDGSKYVDRPQAPPVSETPQTPQYTPRPQAPPPSAAAPQPSPDPVGSPPPPQQAAPPQPAPSPAPPRQTAPAPQQPEQGAPQGSSVGFYKVWSVTDNPTKKGQARWEIRAKDANGVDYKMTTFSPEARAMAERSRDYDVKVKMETKTSEKWGTDIVRIREASQEEAQA